MRIFITGATGYLGYHFTNVAVSQGHQILCLRRTSSASLFEPLVEEYIRWINNDDPEFERKVSEFAPDVLFHAAWSGVRGTERNDLRIQRANIELSIRLFHIFQYKQIIALGSQAEYGFYNGPVTEAHTLNPTMEYAKAKTTVCDALRELCESRKIEWQWLRLFTVFGEKQTGGLIKQFTNNCISGAQTFDTTPGEQIYSYFYTYDFACAVSKMLGTIGKSGIYNIDQIEEDHSNRELIEQIKSMLHSNIHINYGSYPYPDNQIMYMKGDTTKYTNAFGLIQHTDFNEALARTIESFRLCH